MDKKDSTEICANVQNEMKCHHKKMAHKKHSLDKSLFLFGVASLLWFFFRTGTKPTRVVYPCQRAALTNTFMVLNVSLPFSITWPLFKERKFLTKKGTTFILIIIVATALLSGSYWGNFNSVNAVKPNQELHLTLEPKNATTSPASDVFVVNGRAYANISNLINLMGLHGLLFYKCNISGPNQGPNGLIAANDVVLIKINEEWPYRGGTNTDVLKALIQAIVSHPDGFIGEIVVADNGQWQGSMNWPQSNAEDITQSTQDVVNMFSGAFKVSTFSWRPIRKTRVNEYSTGDMANGYVVNDTPDPETQLRVSYPKFTTTFGTRISFKHGIWNGTGYEERLKIINLPVLKSHQWYGVTASVKHYMGVLSEESSAQGFSNGHYTIDLGSMGTMMVETRFPTLNVVDAIWVNANPYPSSMCGPSTPYSWATRVNVLIASTDPIALDYWAAKYVLMQAARLIGYTDVSTIDPDNFSLGAFGYWLNLSKMEILRGGYNVTNDENCMNVYVFPRPVHDIAIIDGSVSKKILGEGFPLQINITVQNQGDYNENFDLTIYANTTAIYTKSILLQSAANRTLKITFTWNTVGFSKSNYNLTALIAPILNETNLADNIFVCGMVKVTIPGDVDGDFFVSITDVAEMCIYWQASVPPASPEVDVNDDEIVNIFDAAMIGMNWLKDP